MPKIIHGLNFAVASPPPFLSLECIFACTVPEIDTRHFKFENLFVKHGGSPKIWFCNVIVFLFISEVDFREKNGQYRFPERFYDLRSHALDEQKPFKND